MLKAILRGAACASWFSDYVIITWEGKNTVLRGAAHALLLRQYKARTLLLDKYYQEDNYYPHYRAHPDQGCSSPVCKKSNQYCIYS